MTEEFLAQNQEQAQQPMSQAPQEKMLPQSEVNEIVGRVRAEATARAQAQMQQATTAQPGSLTEEQVRELIAQQTQSIQAEQARMAMAERVVGEFAGKMDLGKESYEDFEDTVKQIDLSTIPEIVQLANSVGNTHDVMYDLAKNPYKIGNLLTLAKASPHLARAEINRLSQSIVANKSAVAQASGAKEPLSQMKASANISADASKPMTVKDFKSMSWLKR